MNLTENERYELAQMSREERREFKREMADATRRLQAARGLEEAMHGEAAALRMTIKRSGRTIAEIAAAIGTDESQLVAWLNDYANSPYWLRRKIEDAAA